MIANSANLSVAGYVFASVVAFAVILIVAFRPLWWKLVVYVENMNSASMNSGLFCLTLILVFLSAWTTALLGLGACNSQPIIPLVQRGELMIKD